MSHFITVLTLLGVVAIGMGCKTNSQAPAASETSSQKEEAYKKENEVLKEKQKESSRAHEKLRQEFNHLLETTVTWKYASFRFEFGFDKCLYLLGPNRKPAPETYSQEQKAACNEFKEKMDEMNKHGLQGGPDNRKTQGAVFVCNLKELTPEDKKMCDSYIKVLQRAAAAFHFEDDFAPLPSPKLPTPEK